MLLELTVERGGPTYKSPSLSHRQGSHNHVPGAVHALDRRAAVPERPGTHAERKVGVVLTLGHDGQNIIKDTVFDTDPIDMCMNVRKGLCIQTRFKGVHRICGMPLSLSALNSGVGISHLNAA